MKDIIEGTAYVLGNDIDTDQIIPAEHLVYSLSDPEEKKNYGKFALSGVPAENAGLPEGNKPLVPKGDYHSPYTIIIGGKNFGCGSSREHAPACLKIAGIQAVGVHLLVSGLGGAVADYPHLTTRRGLVVVAEIVKAGNIFEYARKVGMIPG